MGTATVNTTKIVGGASDDVLFGGGRSDTIDGNSGQDSMFGGGGNDKMSGDAGDDIMFGDAGKAGKADLTNLKISESVKGTVTFNGETAGYKNAIGYYKIAADGTIYGADILWGNASLSGSGGQLKSGNSLGLDLKAGERLGFFVVPDGYSQSGMAKLLDDQKGSWKFVDAKGNAGNVNAGKEVKLVHVAANGKETDIKSAYGTSVFHSVDDGTKGLNGDKLNHVVASVDATTGSIKIGFEDLKGGGDKDFDDSVITLNIGVTNAALTAKVATKAAGERNDYMDGGDGNDKMLGMSGNDTMHGGAGDDKMWGNSGDDVMSGGDGNDYVNGGAGNDVLEGGAGADEILGNTGNDKLLGGAGNDRLFGNSGNDTMDGGADNDVLDGGSGNDTFLTSSGDDNYIGGSGFDTLDYSGSAAGIVADLSKHVVTGDGTDKVSGIEKLIGSALADNLQGDKGANVLVGGAGNDMLRGMAGADTMTGGEGRDTFSWLAKDIVDGGKHLGIDHITDFSKDDVLDLSKLFKGVAHASVDDVVKLVEAGGSTHVQAAIGGQWQEVVVLDNVVGLTAAGMLHDGMLLA